MSCSTEKNGADAYGNFEVDEITISAQVPGELVKFNIEEGMFVDAGQPVGLIDTTELNLTRLEIIANVDLIMTQYGNLTAQINVYLAEKKNLEREIQRTEKLIESEAATEKQLDELKGSLTVVERKIASIEAQNPNVFNQVKVTLSKMEQLNEKMRKSIIRVPVKGKVLNKIAMEHQLAAPGTPLFIMANLSNMTFRAYISGNQLAEINVGEKVTIKVDYKDGELKSYEGHVTWVADEAEFTPKIIQTREERVDMVYAMKMKVINDGMLKIGMPGEVYFTKDAEGQ
jgi:HlyD family secretion protein